MNTTHRRNEHMAQGNPNSWTQDERIAARQTCAACRLIFTDNGEFRAAQHDPSMQEFRGGPSYPVGAPRAARTATVYPATEKQISFLDKLLAEKEHTLTAEAIDAAKANKKLISPMIDALLAAPRKIVRKPVVEETPAPQVPTGHYALETEDGIKFYKVDCPTEGKWAGFTFLSAQASDDLWPIRSYAQKNSILAAIAADPRGAAVRYGHELGVCGVCGRTLTDADSRAAGIGPVCQAKF